MWRATSREGASALRSHASEAPGRWTFRARRGQRRWLQGQRRGYGVRTARAADPRQQAANHFSAKLPIPEALANACGRDAPVPDELAELLGVTRSAKAVRLKEPVSTGLTGGPGIPAPDEQPD